MKLWDKGISVNKKIEEFTVGNDRQTDLWLAPWDVIGTMAHVTMLEKIGLLTKPELTGILKGLKQIYNEIQDGKFVIEPYAEDVHSQIELKLTHMLGETGKKIHSARSRNDQVLVDIRLFTRDALVEVFERMDLLFEMLLNQSETYKEVLIPGYTHLQAAMPSSFGLWFGAYAESLADDLLLMESAYKIVNQNPLGSAAGYGSSFPIDREMTTRLLGFEEMNYNAVYAQMGRGKTERVVAMGLSSLASTLAKLAYDVCLFTSQNFGFLSLPDEFTTGSSIMPHKKNPDVFELVRARCNKVQGYYFEVFSVSNNLPSGYFRDYQVMKEGFFSQFKEINSCLEMTLLGLSKINVNTNVLDDPKYKFIFSVEEVNREVLKGSPFRDAYKKVAKDIENGTFESDTKINHTHTGSIGNLGNDKIRGKYKRNRNNISTDNAKKAILELLNS